jgi:hypothetical protein
VKVAPTVPLKLTVAVVGAANAGEFAIREAVAANPEARRIRLNLFIITSDVSDVQSNIDRSKSNTFYVRAIIFNLVIKVFTLALPM